MKCVKKNHDIKNKTMSKKRITVLTGAGISAESGIKTFRDAGGLWEGHDVMEVASPQGWNKNRALVIDFYNQRRAQLLEVNPNAGHEAELQYRQMMRMKDGQNLSQKRAACRKERTSAGTTSCGSSARATTGMKNKYSIVKPSSLHHRRLQ